MKGMIFAAGLGTRLKPFTDSHPKALVEVGGEPMLGRVVRKMKAAGIRQIVVNVHHFADQIVDYIADNQMFGVDIAISDERELLLDTGGGIAKAAPLLEDDEPVLVHNADILTDFPIAEMVERHETTGADVTMLVDRRTSSRQLYFDASNRLAGWRNLMTGATRPDGFTGGEEFAERAFGGVHIVSPAVIKGIVEAAKENPVFSIVPFYLDHLADYRIAGYTPSTSYCWFDIGKPETLARANDYVSHI